MSGQHDITGGRSTQELHSNTAHLREIPQYSPLGNPAVLPTSRCHAHRSRHRQRRRCWRILTETARWPFCHSRMHQAQHRFHPGHTCNTPQTHHRLHLEHTCMLSDFKPEVGDVVEFQATNLWPKGRINAFAHYHHKSRWKWCHVMGMTAFIGKYAWWIQIQYRI